MLLEDTLTPAERNLVAKGEHGRLRDTRTYIQYSSVREFCAPVERLTGRKVRSFISGVDTAVAGLSVETFVLHPAGADARCRASTPDGRRGARGRAVVWQGAAEPCAPLQVQRARPRSRLAGVLVVLAVFAGTTLRGDGPAPGVPLVPTPSGGGSEGAPVPDPFAYAPDREDALVERAAAGTSHALYTARLAAPSPAERVAHWRPQAEAAARARNVEPDLPRGSCSSRAPVARTRSRATPRAPSA